MTTVHYIECPAVYGNKSLNELSIFLAGGISNCRDWQTDIVAMFNEVSWKLPLEFRVVLINPRRENFDITNPNMSAEQIEWEHNHLKRTTATLFWFPPETLCPITLYELGVAAAKDRQIFVGCDPDYQRKFDVVKQLSLIRPDIEVVFTLEALVDQVVKHYDYI